MPQTNERSIGHSAVVVARSGARDRAIDFADPLAAGWDFATLAEVAVDVQRTQ